MVSSPNPKIRIITELQETVANKHHRTGTSGNSKSEEKKVENFSASIAKYSSSGKKREGAFLGSLDISSAHQKEAIYSSISSIKV